MLTPIALAQRLADGLRTSGGRWLELGSGTGRLLDACTRTRNPLSYVAVELDAELAACSPALQAVSLLHADVLNPAQLDRALASERFDCVVGNPPFGIERLNDDARARMKSLYPDVQQIKDWGRLDLYFMLESLSRLRRPGEAAFIVAAPIAQDAALAPFRKTLIDAATELECYELPPQTFDNRAEVQSFLLIARFSSKLGARVTLGRLKGVGFHLDVARRVSREDAIRRLDIGHHEFADFEARLASRANFSTLEGLGAHVVRGSRTRHQFEALGVEHFHTSDFPDAGGGVEFDSALGSNFKAAEAGHILVPRVGSRCIDRSAIVSRGSRPFTEAVYRITLPHRARTGVFDWMSSDEGRAWRRAAANGSCAKHLTVTSLMQMPVPA